MKKILLSCLIALAISTSINAQSDELSENQNIIKVNPLGLLFGSATIGYERALGEKSSILILPSYGKLKLEGFKYSQVGIGAEYRFYLSSSKSAPNGIYAAPGISYYSGKVTINDGNGDHESKFASFGAKAVFGNQWIFNSGFVIDLNGGISYQNFKYKNTTGVFSDLKVNGVFPTLNFSIGYNF